MSKQVQVAKIPACDICKHQNGVTTPAYADAKLADGPWAYVCKAHFALHSCKLGTGRGQELIEVIHEQDNE